MGRLRGGVGRSEFFSSDFWVCCFYLAGGMDGELGMSLFGGDAEG